MLPTFSQKKSVGGHKDISQFLNFLRSHLFLQYPGYLGPVTNCENVKGVVENKVETKEMTKLTVYLKIFISKCPMLINDSNVLFQVCTSY